jgi:hypothetical protein
MTSFADVIAILGRQIDADLTTLLAGSKLSERHDTQGGLVLVTPNPFAWEPLPPSLLKVQRRLRKDFEKFYAFMKLVLADEPGRVVEELDEHCQVIEAAINQDNGWMPNAEDYRVRSHNSINNIVKLLRRFDAEERTPLLIPDTNVLIDHPNFAAWQFDGIESFVVIIVPAVLQELDALKLKKDVAPKARRAIRRLQEIRTDGARLSRGITLDSGRITVRSFESDSQTERIVRWLDPNHADDRILGCVLEVMRREPFAPVALVTGDINLQNKADFAEVSFLEPPAPSDGAP